MRKAILFIILFLLLVMVSCSQPQTESMDRQSFPLEETSTQTIPSVNELSPNTPVSIAPDPYPAPVQSNVPPAGTIAPYPAPVQSFVTPGETLGSDPAPGQTIGAPPTPDFTPSPSPTIYKPTPTFPASLESLRIAYIAGRKLWLWQRGTAQSLTDVDERSYQVKISADGELIAFTRESGLWAIQSDGTGERLLIGKEQFEKMEPTDPGVALSQMDWVPHTHILLFNTTLLTGYGIKQTDDLHLVDAGTQHYEILLSPGKGGNFIPSPDGKRIAIMTPTEIRLMDVIGSNYHTVLTYPGVAIPSEFSYYARPVWAPDSNSLMVAIPPTDVYYESTSPTVIWQLPTDETPPAQVSEIGAERGQYIFISPDFSKIAILRFLKQEVTHMFYELHLAKIDGSEDVLYYSGEALFSAWAEDSERFVFQIDQGYFLGQLGSEIVPITEQGDGLSWVEPANFLYTYNASGLAELRLGFIGEPGISLAGPEVSPIYFDYSE